MQSLQIVTNRSQNVGRSIINKLQSMGVYGHVDIKTIHTERNCATRTKTTLVGYTPKSK